MEWLDTVLGAVGSGVAGVASGGLLSVFGALFKGVGNYFAEKQRQAFRKQEWDHELKLLDKEMERNDRDAENEVKIADTEGSWRGLEASYNTVIASSQVHKIVNDIRALYRPVLTSGLLWLVWLIFKDMLDVLKSNEAALSAAFTPEQAGESVRFIVQSVVFTACTAATWWFGDRALSPGSKNR